ncbi:hypothetical protein NMY22_g13437 [Coprinellus aureogranulatus]|nr:hypothetical protein NMY22_g13437 [Coprinellus aureogranulatus]
MPPSRTLRQSSKSKGPVQPPVVDKLAECFASLPFNLWKLLLKGHLRWRHNRTISETASFSGGQTTDGHPTVVILLNKEEALRWVGVVQSYYTHRTPRCRPNVDLSSLDPNTRFWVRWSPFRFLRELEITITGPLPYQDLSSSEVSNMGRHLAWLPLLRLTFHTRHIDPLLNGIVHWPRLVHPTEVILNFTWKCPPHEWQRPFFPHSLRSFTALKSLSIQVSHAGGNLSPRARPHALFEEYARGFPHIQRQRGETSAATLRRVGRNISQVCPELGRIAWMERRNSGQGCVKKEVVHERNFLTDSWVQVV